MSEKGLIRKLGLTSRFMTSQTGKQIIIIHMLHNIPRSKGKQTIRFGQITEYNVKNEI